MTGSAVSRVGAHVPVAGGLARRGLAYAADVGAEVIQVFVGNPRAWSMSRGDPAEDARLRERADLPVFVHAPYLINPGAPDPEVAARSRSAIDHALRRGTEIGARGVVVHTGSAVHGSRAVGLERVREALFPVLAGLSESAPMVLLEPMAGQGRALCAAVEEVADYLEALEWHPKAGVCLDTAHAFAAGHDISTPAGMVEMLDRLARTVDTRRLRLIHANDSAVPCGGRNDRHANIGAGYIGTEPFAAVFTHPASAGVPVVVETPGPAKPHAADIGALKRLRSRGTVPPSPLPESEHGG